MSQKERDRSGILSQVKTGAISLLRASEVLKLSYRQCGRLLSRYRSEGDAGLIHRGRGRVSNHKLSVDLRQEVLELIETHYSDYGPTLASEILLERHQISVSRESLRGWMTSSGLWKARKRKVVHRQWRERRTHLGELVQMDTSEHDWLEGRGEKIYLISMIDDATSRLTARFYTSDSTAANMDLLTRYIRGHGRPVSLYTDKASHFVYNGPETIAEQLSGLRPQTQIGRALTVLDIDLILANSPQAKGRVERLFKTLQDRLVKRLRLVGANDLNSANQCLDSYFRSFWNNRFSVAPTNGVNLHRSVAGYSLSQIFSIHNQRTVTNDYTFSLNSQRYQIERRSVMPGLRGGKILVETRLNGQVKAKFRAEYLHLKKLPRVAKSREVKKDFRAVVSSSSGSATLHPLRPTQRRVASNRQAGVKPT